MPNPLYPAPRHRLVTATRDLEPAKPSFLHMFTQAFAWCMLAILIILLACAGPTRAEQPPQETAQKIAEKQELVRVIYRMKICMTDATIAALRQNVASRQAIEVFVAASCGIQFRAFLMTFPIPRWSQTDADSLIVELAQARVRAILEANK